MLYSSKYIFHLNIRQGIDAFHPVCFFKLFLRNFHRNNHVVMGERIEKEWKIFGGQNDLELEFKNYGILILNRPIVVSAYKIIKLWNEACWRITVDGGTDMWFDFVKQHSLSLSLPNYVTGDFDSINPETLEFCRQHDEITVKNTPDQDFTDFEKAVDVLIKTCPHKLDCFVTILEHSGRLDQTFSNLNILARVPLPGFMISESAITWLLRPGCHVIHIPHYFHSRRVYCGILPFSSEAKVTTKGLKWNLNNDIIKFGGMISSSNTYDESPVVDIDTDSNVIWTMGTEKLYNSSFLLTFTIRTVL